MTKQWTNLIAIFLRRIPITTATIDSSHNVFARNAHYRHYQWPASVWTFKRQKFATSSHAEQESSSVTDTDRNAVSSGPQYVCHLRDLPHVITPKLLIDALSREKIVVKGGTSGVHFFFNRETPRTGLQAYVELASETDFNNVKSKPQIIKKKMVDVCAADLTKMREDLRDWAYTVPEGETFIRLDGLPYDWTYGDLKQFFDGFDVDIVQEDLTRLPKTGIVFVKLPSQDIAERVIEQNQPRRYVKDRYVEIRISSAIEAIVAQEKKNTSITRKENRKFDEEETDRNEPVAGGRPELTVYLRGLPYWVDEDRINNFFSPLRPESVQLCRMYDGRFNGCAYVSFSSPSDVDKALKKDKQRISSRYIEIFRQTDGW